MNHSVSDDFHHNRMKMVLKHLDTAARELKLAEYFIRQESKRYESRLQYQTPPSNKHRGSSHPNHRNGP